jgi:hypothetical protein
MRVQNMISRNGNKVPSQFIIFTPEATFFQSYDTIIVKTTFEASERVVYLDSNSWDYSVTTSKYRNMFLGEDTKTIKAKIKSCEYKLTDLNGGAKC